MGTLNLAMRYFVLVLLFCALLLPSCVEDADTPSGANTIGETFFLYFDYKNETGIDPTVDLKLDSSSTEIQLDVSQDISFEFVGSFLIDILFRNIRVETDDKVYQILDVYTEVLHEGKWERDQDFITQFSPIPELDIVLVLDASNSLETGIEVIKEISKGFITNVKRLAPSARLGLVSFATSINTQELTVNGEILHNFIDEIELEQFTKLYEGMDTGISLLESVSENSLQAIITLTDGRDNFSDIAFTPESILGKLVASDGKGSPPQSFMIGYETSTSLNRTILDTLAVNGLVRYPTSLAELRSVFNLYARVLSANFQITYQKNNQVITEPENMRFVVRAIPFEIE